MNLSISRETAALDDPAAVDSLLAPLPTPPVVRAYLAKITGEARHLCQYDPHNETLHYVASDGQRLVRLSVAGLPLQRAAGAILATHDVLNASAKAVGVKLEKMLVLPARAHAATHPVPPSKHLQMRETLRMVPVARVPTL